MRLSAIVSDIPHQRLDAQDIIRQAGGRSGEARVFSKLFGIEQVATLPATTSLQQVFLQLIDRLSEQSGDVAGTDTLIYAHALPVQPQEDGALTTALCRQHTALRSVVRCYEINQHNCGSLFWALQAAWRLFDTGIAQRVAIVAGDTLSPFPQGQRYIPGCTLLGDAFVALLLDNRPDGHQLTRPYLQHRAEFYPGLFGESPLKRQFYDAHNQMIEDALQGCGYTPDSHGALLPHNINRLTWLNYSRLFPRLEGAIDLSLLQSVGHCCATDPFLLLDQRLNLKPENPQPLCLLSVGAGAFIGACTLLPGDTSSSASPGNP